MKSSNLDKVYDFQNGMLESAWEEIMMAEPGLIQYLARLDQLATFPRIISTLFLLKKLSQSNPTWIRQMSESIGLDITKPAILNLQSGSGEFALGLASSGCTVVCVEMSSLAHKFKEKKGLWLATCEPSAALEYSRFFSHVIFHRRSERDKWTSFAPTLEELRKTENFTIASYSSRGLNQPQIYSKANCTSLFLESSQNLDLPYAEPFVPGKSSWDISPPKNLPRALGVALGEQLKLLPLTEFVMPTLNNEWQDVNQGIVPQL